MHTNHHYNKYLTKFANENRKNFTKSEAIVWKHLLSRRQMLGYQFRRQRPIGKYIADFVCLPLKLIIEVDGYTHEVESTKDKKRDEELAALGFTTLRFDTQVVFCELGTMSEIISEWILSNAIIPPPNIQDE